jgi:hypothetical protein
MNGAAKPKKLRRSQRPKINNTKAAIKRLPPSLSQQEGTNGTRKRRNDEIPGERNEAFNQ